MERRRTALGLLIHQWGLLGDKRTSRIYGFTAYIERVNEPFLAAGGSGEQFRAGIERAIALGWLLRHESGTYVRFTDSGAVLFP
jgi:hypothetical protein